MLDEILGKVKNEIGGDILSKFNLTEEKKEKAFSLTGDSIMEAISGAKDGGFMDAAMNLFSSNSNDVNGNALLNSIGSNLLGKFSNQLNMEEGNASSLKDMILNKVFSLFGDKLGSNFNITDLLSMVSSGNSGSSDLGGLMNKVSGFFK